MTSDLFYYDKYGLYGRRVYAQGSDPAGNRYRIENWVDKRAYPSVDDLDINGWRWEFVRRSTSYRQYWEAAHEPDAEIMFEVTGCSSPGIKEYFDLIDLIDPRLSAKQMGDGIKWTRKNLLYFIDQDPSEDEIDEISVAELYYNDLHSVDYKEKFAEPGVLMATIDARQPLKPQFAAIERFIANDLAEKSWDRNRAEMRLRNLNYPIYLRLLDARDTESPLTPSWREIAEQLSLERPSAYSIDEVRRLHRQARETQQNFLAQRPQTDLTPLLDKRFL
ncbi:MAG: hypothetical protein JSR78_16715 [Proteobacteria bacterium]|nr:hypothetical protein [Pseudomonadota bacterium]